MRLRPLTEALRSRWDRPARAGAVALQADLPYVLALWLAAGYGLSRVTGRVTDWFLMTDELLYERLAISIAGSGSPFPQVREEMVGNVSQLYPLLIAPAFRDGLVPESLHDAHVLNAFLMTSVAIPAFLLARSAIGRRWAAALVAFLSVAVPWLTLSSFLLTEVAAYPAFAWAVLAMHHATASPRVRNDVLALLAMAVATTARVQFIVLFLVLPLAVLLHEAAFAGRGRRAAALKDVLARHRVLAVAYGVAGVVAVTLAASGRLSSVLGTYAVAAQGEVLPRHIGRAFAEHLAVLGLSFGILPFLVASAWLLASLVRPGERRLHAFASVATVTLVLVTFQVASFNLRFGTGIVRERYLFYVVPVVLVALAAALTGRSWPRWSLLVPTALVIAGFATGPLPLFQKLNVDTPSAVFNDRILALGQSLEGARLGLALATGVLVLLFAQASRLVPRPFVAGGLAAIVLFALPAGTAYAFSRLFAVEGTSGRPLTHDQAVVFTWVDRALGPDARVTMIPFPTLYGDYWAGVSFWWDLEFWNRSVVRGAYRNEEFQNTPSTFPSLQLRFDPRTGAANHSSTRYVTQFAGDTRFRIAGPRVAFERNTLLIDAGSRWRADWVTSGLYADGWTRPGRPALIRVFSTPDQSGPVTRSLGVFVRGPGGGVTRPLSVVSGAGRWDGVAGDDGVAATVPLCVPAGGFADVRIEAEGSSPILGEPINPHVYARPREGGVFVTEIGLADEISEGC